MFTEEMLELALFAIVFATYVGMDADVTLSSGSPEKLLPQKKRPAHRPCIDLSKISKAAAAKTCI